MTRQVQPTLETHTTTGSDCKFYVSRRRPFQSHRFTSQLITVPSLFDIPSRHTLNKNPNSTHASAAEYRIARATLSTWLLHDKHHGVYQWRKSPPCRNIYITSFFCLIICIGPALVNAIMPFLASILSVLNISPRAFGSTTSTDGRCLVRLGR